MKFCRNVLYNAKKILIKRSMKYTHTILIGENASGKSELLREYVEELLSEGENVYYIDSVNRYFDVSKVSTPYSNIKKSSSESVVKIRMEREYFNLKDTFSLFGTLNDRIELIYLEYEQRLQMMLKNFLGFSFEMKGIKEKEVWFESEAEGVLSSGIQALVRIFLELLYLNDMKKNHVHIVIDEIDEFLSPSNSGKILDFLITQFPNLDFLVSTHSIDLVKNAKKCNIMILYNTDIEVVDADDFCTEYDAATLFEKVFPCEKSRKETIEDRLRILLNNRISEVWTEENKAELSQLEKSSLTNSQKLLVQQIKEWEYNG